TRQAHGARSIRCQAFGQSPPRLDPQHLGIISTPTGFSSSLPHARLSRQKAGEDVMRLQGKVAIVTGGGSGFGEAIARRFAEEGAKLVVNDINDDGGARVVQAIEGAHGQGSAAYLRADVSRDADMAQLIAGSLDRYGRIDIMINNAGITHVNRPM